MYPSSSWLAAQRAAICIASSGGIHLAGGPNIARHRYTIFTCKGNDLLIEKFGRNCCCQQNQCSAKQVSGHKFQK